MNFTTQQKLDYLAAQRKAATVVGMWELAAAIDMAIQLLERSQTTVGKADKEKETQNGH